jgi:hypothetical protein
MYKYRQALLNLWVEPGLQRVLLMSDKELELESLK